MYTYIYVHIYIYIYVRAMHTYLCVVHVYGPQDVSRRRLRLFLFGRLRQYRVWKAKKKSAKIIVSMYI